MFSTFWNGESFFCLLEVKSIELNSFSIFLCGISVNRLLNNWAQDAFSKSFSGTDLHAAPALTLHWQGLLE